MQPQNYINQIKEQVSDELDILIPKYESWADVPHQDRMSIYLKFIDRADEKCMIAEFCLFDTFWDHFVEGKNTVGDKVSAYDDLQKKFEKDIRDSFYDHFEEAFDQKRVEQGFII